MRTSHRIAAILLAGILPACSEGGGNAANGAGGNQANVAVTAPSVPPVVTNDAAAAVDPQSAYDELLECAATMEASRGLIEQVARSKTGDEQARMTLDVTARRGRAGALRAYADSASRPLNLTMEQVREQITARAAEITRERRASPVEDYANIVGERADACYARAG